MLAERGVGGLDRLDGGRDRAGVADHVRIGQVDDREAVAVVGQGPVEFVGDLRR